MPDGAGHLCQGVRRDGAACTAPARPSGYCFAHDPALGSARAAGRARGGQGRGAGARLRRAVPPNLHAVLDRLIEAMEACHEGELEPRVASAMASLAGAIVRVYEVGELALRVAALEEHEPAPDGARMETQDQGPSGVEEGANEDAPPSGVY